MGFRGEALPSIAAVSRLTLTTRAADAAADAGAYELTVDGGIAGEGRHVGAPVGTRVDVLEPVCECAGAAQVHEERGRPNRRTCRRRCCGWRWPIPATHFRLRSEGAADPRPAAAWQRPRACARRRSVAVARRRKLQLAAGDENGVTVEAYLGSPADSANTSRGTYLFVNRRFVRDRSLLHAVSLGYGETLERGRFPLAVVHVTLAGSAVDVNVHPQKLEVRFARAQEVYAAVRHAIARAVADAPWLQSGSPVAPSDRAPAGSVRSRLGVYTLPPQASFGGWRDDGSATNAADDGAPSRRDDGANAYGGDELRAREGDVAGYGSGPRDTRWLAREPQLGYAERRRRAEEAMRLFAPAEPLFDARPPADSDGEASANLRPALPSGHDNAFFSSLIYLGQLHRTYLVCQAHGELVLIDQHAAHERVAFQRLREAHSRRAAASQRLLLPATVELESALAAAAAEHADLLTTLGFEIERFGERTLVVRALPDVLAQAEPSDVLTEVLGELAAREATELVSDRLDHVLATMACHSVVRAGDVLSEREVRALLVSMDGIDYRAHCPHGRPVLLRMSLGEIERRFGRS